MFSAGGGSPVIYVRHYSQSVRGACPKRHRVVFWVRSPSWGVLEIDTNLVANMIRPTKLGMKNWMFFGSLEAGTNNAPIYTLLANCRAHDLDP